MVVELKGDLFSAPSPSFLLHACNAQGVWGSGIAVTFKEKFPKSYTFYTNVCRENTAHDLLGRALFCGWENGYGIVCLMTSENYGDLVDPPEKILHNTELSMDFFFRAMPYYLKNLDDIGGGKWTSVPVCMPKINSGRFRTPWEQTLKVLNKFSQTINVYSQE